jgi:hypothetical protein
MQAWAELGQAWLRFLKESASRKLGLCLGYQGHCLPTAQAPPQAWAMLQSHCPCYHVRCGSTKWRLTANLEPEALGHTLAHLLSAVQS